MKFKEFHKTGKYYKTRGGTKVRIIGTDEHPTFPLIAEIYCNLGNVWLRRKFKSNGQWHYTKNSMNDIVGEWEEKASNQPKESKFKVGDMIECTVGRKYRITGRTDHFYMLDGKDALIDMVDDYCVLLGEYMPESNVSTIARASKCECGADHVKGLHSHWCPKYEKL